MPTQAIEASCPRSTSGCWASPKRLLNFSNATIRSISVKNFDHDVDLFIDLYNRSLIVNWGFVPLEPPEGMRKLAESMRHLLIPQLTTFAEVEGRVVGAVFGMPDYNPRIKKINGRLFPFGVFTLLSKKKDFRRIRVIQHQCGPRVSKVGTRFVADVELGAQGTGDERARRGVLLDFGRQ